MGMTAIDGIATSLYDGGLTLHSPLGLGVGEKHSTTAHVSQLSKYGPRAQRAELLLHLQLLVLRELSMLLRELLELMDVLWKELRSSETQIAPPFGGLTIVFVGDYTHNFSGVPSFCMDPETGGNVCRVYTTILNEFSWKSRLWTQCPVQVQYLTEEVKQEEDPQCAALLRAISHNTITITAPPPLQSTGEQQTADQFLWKWVTTRWKEDVDLSTMLTAPTDWLVDEHNMAVLDLFLGQWFMVLSATTVSPYWTQNSDSDIPDTVVPKFAYITHKEECILTNYTRRSVLQ